MATKPEAVTSDIVGDNAVISPNLPVKLGVSKAAIGKLKKKFKDVPDVTTKDGYADCKSAISELRPLRTGVEKERKKLVAGAVEWQKKVNAQAKELTEAIAEIEQPFVDAKKAQDEKVEREKREAAEKEEKRIADIEAKIAAFQTIPGEMLGADTDTMKAKLAELEEMKITVDEFMEFVEPASLVLGQVKAQLTTAIAGQEALEAQQALLKEQQEALAEQQAKIDAQAAELKEKEEAQAEAEAEKNAEEQRRQREKEEQEERERKQAELDARLPEDRKLQAYVDKLIAVEKPDIKNPYLVQILDDVNTSLQEIQHSVYAMTQSNDQV